MSKFDRIFIFNHEGGPYMLLRVLNYGTNSDELKFTFVDKRFQRGVIYTKESFRVKEDDIITDYGEITYHSDGSVLWKHPRYPIDSEKYINPKEEGHRRRRLSDIDEWEPLVKYEVFNYRPCGVDEKYIKEKSDKIYMVKNKSVFNGQPFICLVNLVHKNYNVPGSIHSTEEILRIPGITKSLDLWLVISNISKAGNYLEIDGSDEEIFITNNIVQIVEKND